MEKSYKQRFHELILEWKELVNSLTDEERKGLNLATEDYDEYERNYFTSTSESSTMKEIEDEYSAAEGIKTVQMMICQIKEKVLKFHDKKEKKSLDLTPIKILSRYMKLSDSWKRFLRIKLGSERLGHNEDDTVEIFALMNNNTNSLLVELDGLLREIEKVQ